MAIKTIVARRGTDAERQTVTPANGEFIWTTDLKELWVGDGVTLGGVKVTGSGGGGAVWGAITGTITDQTDLTTNFLRKNVADTASGYITFSAGIDVGDNTGNIGAGVRFEGGKHSISNNDGGGNFNIRVGNDYTTGCTEAGYVGHQVFNQALGKWEFNLSNASLAVNDAPTWVTGLTITPTSVSANGDFTASGNIVGDRISLGYDPATTNSIACSNWFRSSGSTGWYNGTYGGGMYMIDTTWVRVYNSKALLVSNTIASTGNIGAYYSDMRFKTKVGDIENPIDKVCSLTGFYYVENELAREMGYTNEEQQIALSAQEVQAVVPEAVALAPIDYETLEDGTVVSKSGENYLTVDYARLVPLLVEAIKEQQTQIDGLVKEVETLKGK